jgi:predicted PurR-regulated permease PerM
VVDGGAARRAAGVLVAVAATVMAFIVLPIWKPLLLAALFVGVLEPMYLRQVARFSQRRSLLAALYTLGLVILVLLPLTAIAVIAIREVVSAAGHVRAVLSSDGLPGLLAEAPPSLVRLLHRLQDRLPGVFNELRAQVSASGKWALATLSGGVSMAADLAFQLAMMLIAFFFLLRDGPRLVDWMERATPLPPGRVRELMHEFHVTARSVLGANLVTGAVQAAVATVGFVIARAPSPILLGLLTMLASLIPSVGTALVTFPVAGLLLVLGHRWAALFLALWALFVVGLVDNLVRPILIRGGTHVHGALVFFSLIGAVGAFGAVGIFLGPLALTFFIAALRINRSMRGDGWMHEPG